MFKCQQYKINCKDKTVKHLNITLSKEGLLMGGPPATMEFIQKYVTQNVLNKLFRNENVILLEFIALFMTQID